MASPRRDDPEVECIRRAQLGEGEAFGLLVERYQRRVLALVYRLVRRREEAEELAQEIFVKAYLAIQGYNFQASFGTWLLRIGVNHCYDYLRRQRVSRVTYFSEMSPQGEQAVMAGSAGGEASADQLQVELESRELAQKLLERAPAEDRVILTLKELEDLSVEEIAQLLELKPSTVKVRLHRARKRMLKDFQRWRQGR